VVLGEERASQSRRVTVPAEGAGESESWFQARERASWSHGVTVLGEGAGELESRSHGPRRGSRCPEPPSPRAPLIEFRALPHPRFPQLEGLS
jgi:hypothetical protein